MKNNKSIYIVGIFMLVTMVSIGYAILIGQLNINGTSKVKAASWDIYFANVKVKDGSVTASVKPSITDKTTVNFEVELSKPGDYYEFNVDVVNDGDLDAMIESISITPELTVNQQKYLSYSVTYLDDVPLEVKDILHAKKTRTLKVKVEYLKSVENDELNSNDEILNIHAEIKYVQADSTAKEPLSVEGEILKTITLVTGDGTNVGDEIAIGDEHFYVVSNDGIDIVMLAKYNLLVGDICTDDNKSSCTPIENPTGIQDETAKGYQYLSGINTRIGVVPFSETQYWGTVENYTFVYNNQASISNYVNNYKEYLESLGADIIEARLLTIQEIEKLGCNLSSSRCGSDNPWKYSTSYWSGSATQYSSIWGVCIGAYNNYLNYNTFARYGVRPVIVIPADSI